MIPALLEHPLSAPSAPAFRPLSPRIKATNKHFEMFSKNQQIVKLSILYFPIAHNAPCLPPQILHKPLLRNALGNMQTSQEYFTTIVMPKFGGQT